MLEPARTFRIVLDFANQSLMSGGNFVEARYVSVCNGDKFNIYDGRTATIALSEGAALKG